MKIVVAYSGGLDTSVLLTWLKDEYNADIVAYCADLGQEEELDGLEEKALNTGAQKCYVDDLREEFARDFIFPMIRGNALYEGLYYLGTSIARPLIAKRQIEIAMLENADAVAHGATGKGNDQVRFELTFAALAPQIQVIAPWRTWDFKGRTDLINYAKSKKIPVTVSAKKPYSMDRNLLHISYESGILEDPWVAPDEKMFILTRSPEKAPATGETIELDFRQGDCVALNGEKMSAARIVYALNKLGGKHGVGRVDMVENRFVGMKSRGVYETPGGTILSVAHRHLETITMDREVMHLRDSLIPKYSELIYNGFWYAPEREFIQASIDQSQENVTGSVRLKLYKGNIIVEGRKSKVSLYQSDVASMEDDAGAYDQSDATGFIRLNGLRLKARAQKQKPYKDLLAQAKKKKRRQ